MEGRGWEDCLAFTADNPALQIPQVDTVEGGRGDKCVLPTIMFLKLLKDCGTEFSNPLAVEISPADGTRRTKVFYTRPYTATDKPFVERNHEYIRRIVFKGESFDGLARDAGGLDDVARQQLSSARPSWRAKPPAARRTRGSCSSLARRPPGSGTAELELAAPRHSPPDARRGDVRSIRN